MTAEGLTLAQSSALAVVLLAAVWLLYRLKDHRPRVVVAFSGLWHEVLASSLTRQWHERLRRTVSLLIHWLVAGLICASLLADDPAGGSQTRHLLILLDTSASMSVQEHQATRFAAAQRELIHFLENLDASTEVLLAIADAQLLPLLPWTSDRQALIAEVRRLAPTASVSNWRDCLESAASYLEQKTRPGLLLVTDAAAVDWKGLAVAPRLAQLPLFSLLVGESSYNVGIVGIAARSRPDDYQRTDLMIALANNDERQHTVVVEVGSADRIVGSERVTLAANGRKRLDLTDVALDNHTLAARVKVLDAPQDGLALDDEGYVALPEAAKSRIAIVSNGDLYLEAAVLSDSRFEPKLLPPQSQLDPRDFDAAIYHASEPDGPLRVPTLFVDPPQGSRRFRTGSVIRNIGFDTWNRQSALLRELDIYDVQIDSGRPLQLEPGDEGLARAGRDVLLARGRRDGMAVVAMGFDPSHSDFVLRPTWPLFIRQVLEVLASRDTAETQAVRPFQSVDLPAPAENATATIQGPGGQQQVAVVAGKPWSIVPERVGLYEITASRRRTFVAVNLASATESQIAPMRPLRYGDRQLSPPPQPRRSWGYPKHLLFAAAALLLLLVEWVTYHRRITV